MPNILADMHEARARVAARYDALFQGSSTETPTEWETGSAISIAEFCFLATLVFLSERKGLRSEKAREVLRAFARLPFIRRIFPAEKPDAPVVADILREICTDCEAFAASAHPEFAEKSRAVAAIIRDKYRFI